MSAIKKGGLVMMVRKGDTDMTEITIPEITDLDCTFGGAMKILPPYTTLPEEFRRGDGPFCNAVSMLFFKGGKLSDHGLAPKAGVDETKVYRVLRACLGDFAPAHEHKIGGTGYLLSQWYDHK